MEDVLPQPHRSTTPLKTGFMWLTDQMFRLKNLAQVCSLEFSTFLDGSSWCLLKNTALKGLIRPWGHYYCQACFCQAWTALSSRRQVRVCLFFFSFILHHLSSFNPASFPIPADERHPHSMILPPPCIDVGTTVIQGAEFHCLSFWNGKVTLSSTSQSSVYVSKRRKPDTQEETCSDKGKSWSNLGIII